MKYSLIVSAVAALLLLAACGGNTSQEPQAVSAETLQKDEVTLLNYSYGYLIGERASEALDNIDFAVFSRGLYDAVNSGTSTVSNEVMLKAIEEYGNAKQAAEQAKQQEAAAANLAKSEEFLREFATQEGVKPLDQGVLYRVITAGDGTAPTDANTVKVHYKGSLVDGTVFDSSYERGEPVEFPLGDVIQGWQIALRAMKTGDKWEVALPSAVAYGANGIPGAIPPNATLVFEIELLAIVK